MTSNVQMVYSQCLKTWGVGSPEWDGYTLHLLRVLTYLQIHVCSPEKEKTWKFWCKKKQIFGPREKSSPISQIVTHSPRPPGKMQCYKSIIPWLCACYSLAMSRGSVGHSFSWLVHLTFGHRDIQKMSVFANCLTMYCKPFKNVMYVCVIYVT